ncbi:unnamed protein product [Adineta ricciae]|nr:unnamed protein product [Adineta ricciae]
MNRTSSSVTSTLSMTTAFLSTIDDENEVLDQVQVHYTTDESDDSSSDSRSELDEIDDDCHGVTDKTHVTYGSTNRGGRELYMNGYSYQVKTVNTMTTRWRCTVRTPLCGASIYTNNIDNTFSRWNGVYHSHVPDENRELIREIIAKIKARVLSEPYPVMMIAEEEIRNAKLDKTQLAAMPLPCQLESALQKHRRKTVPALPKSLIFEIPSLYQHTWSGGQFILADVLKERGDERLIMFSSDEQIELLLNSSTWFCDGTFKTRPALFEQVYIIQCLTGDQDIRKIDCYLLLQWNDFCAFSIRSLTGAASRGRSLAVNTIVSDYEDAWLCAVKNTVNMSFNIGPKNSIEFILNEMVFILSFSCQTYVDRGVGSTLPSVAIETSKS